VLGVSFSALTLMVQWQEGHPAYKWNPCHLSQRFSSTTSEERKPRNPTNW